MGLDLNVARFLVQSKKAGASFDKSLLFGRAEITLVISQAQDLLRRNLIDPSPLDVLKDRPLPQFAEPFFKALGATEVSSLDASDYQQATHVHDMNLPVPESLKNRFDAIYDGGSIEHVFNFPVAIKNSMEMLKPGGRLFIHTAGNNLFGHGFYQFSPELFHRVFTEKNGFAVERMVIHPIGPYGQWRLVADPQVIKSRIELISFVPVLLLIEARKLRTCPIFESFPQQSDYVETWKESAPPTAPARAPFAALEAISPALVQVLRGIRTGLEFYRRQSLGNRKFFTPIDKNK